MKLLIRGGTIVNADKIFAADILIDNKRIIHIDKNITEHADKIIDAQGKHIFPAFIDLHTHLRTPGREDEEDFLSGSLSAAKGGFTKIFCMPNTEPPIDNEGLAKWVVEESKRINIVDIYPVCAITKNREGKELTEFGALRKAGCLALSDDGSSISNALILRRALEYARMENILIISHCENKALSDQGSIRESFISSKYGVSSIPAISESIIVSRDIAIAKYLDTKIHLAHISTQESIEIIRRAKEEGVKVSCETAPHYWTLSVEDIEKRNFDSNFKVNPPIGTREDIEAVKKALQDGVIDCIATDHAPHSQAEKELPFEQAPFGMIGLETAFSLSYTYLVKVGVMDLSKLAEKMSYNPAKIAGLYNCGKIGEERDADLVIVDLNKKWQVQKDTILSKSKNTPFLDYELDGVIEWTIRRGKIVYKNEY